MKLTDFLRDVGQPLAYYPGLKKITGSTVASIFMCQLLYWNGKQSDPDGWIYKTQDEIEEETGLTRYEQETARKILKSKGFLEEKYKGIPRRLYYRLNLEKINEAWEKSQKIIKNQHIAVSPQTSMLESHTLACGDSTDRHAGIPHAITENTTENTSENTTTSEVVVSHKRREKLPFSLKSSDIWKAIKAYRPEAHVDFQPETPEGGVKRLLNWMTHIPEIKNPAAFLIDVARNGMSKPQALIQAEREAEREALMLREMQKRKIKSQKLRDETQKTDLRNEIREFICSLNRK